jgi:hypothetical protein
MTMAHRSLLKISAFTLVFVTASSAAAQSINCGTAVYQLQNYVAQVNAIANNEAWQGIPYRCQGNPYCVNMMMVQLNGWYSQQANLVNGWYAQIVNTCAAPPASSQDRIGSSGRRTPTRIARNDEGQLDEEQIEDLEIDNEDRTVRIRIPSTAQGFRPR